MLRLVAYLLCKLHDAKTLHGAISYKTTNNKIGSVYSLEYADIPKVFPLHITGTVISMATKKLTNDNRNNDI